MAERRQCGEDVLRIATPHVVKAPTESLCAGAHSCLVEIKLVLQPECARLDAPRHQRAYTWLCAKQTDGRKMHEPLLLTRERERRSLHRAKANLVMRSCVCKVGF